MSAANGLTSLMQRPLRPTVYVRRALAPFAARPPILPINGELGDWLAEPRLRVDQVKWEKGASVGHAKFTHVGEGDLGEGTDIAFEDILFRRTTDDQVRVVLPPIDDERVGAPGISTNDSDADAGRVIFEGVLTRNKITVQDGDESVGFSAQPFPVLDNDASDHLIRGRWVKVDDVSSVSIGTLAADRSYDVIESPRLPAVFNRKGRPNRHATSTLDVAATDLAIDISGPTWTHDEDASNGRMWTVGEAIRSILAMWLLGEEEHPLDRHVDIEQDTLQGLDGTITSSRFVGLDQVLPPTSVHGLGVFEALDKVCRAGGFDFQCEPRGGVDAFEFPYDRRYVLRLWRRHSGNPFALKLDRRGSGYTRAESATARNNNAHIVAIEDSQEIVNEVFGVAPVLIEARFQLKPMWSPNDLDSEVTGANIDESMQADDNKKRKALTDTYFMRHVSGGAAYDSYRHVGRRWGLDTFGDFSGYDTGIYQHDAGGVNFLELLQEGGPVGPAQERSRHQVFERMRWFKRPRRIMPMRSLGARVVKRKYYLEVSEDADADPPTWSYCPATFSVFRDRFAIELRGPAFNNLALVNNEALLRGTPVSPTQSWWKLIDQKKLSFRLTCAIEADHAARSNEHRQSSSGTRYRRGQMIVAPWTDVWVQPRTIFNDNGVWLKSVDYGDLERQFDQTDNLRQIGQRRRDKLEDRRVSCSATTWMVDPGMYTIGDVCTGIDGRDHPFQANAGRDPVYPNLVAMTFDLSGPKQLLRLHFDDQVLTKGN